MTHNQRIEARFVQLSFPFDLDGQVSQTYIPRGLEMFPGTKPDFYFWLEQCKGYRNIPYTKLDQEIKAGHDRLLAHTPEMDIDCILYSRKVCKKMELKIIPDYKARNSRNFFVELETKDGSPSWGWNSKADLFAFLVGTQEPVLVTPGKLRLLISNLEIQSEPPKRTSSSSKTQGVLIPIQKSREIAYPINSL